MTQEPEVSRPRARALVREPGLSAAPALRHPLLRAVLGVVVVVLSFVVLLGRRRQLSGMGSELGSVRVPILVPALVLEGCAVAAFAVLEWRLLADAEVHPGLRRVLGITLGGIALQNSLPAGSAWSSVFAYDQFRRQQASRQAALWVVIAQGLLVLVVLAVVTAIALLAAALGPLRATLAALVGALVVLLAARLGTGRLQQKICGLGSLSHRAMNETLRSVRPTPEGWAIATAAAAASLGADCGCLALSFVAVGQHVPWRALIPAYCVAQLATRVPLSPGGLGLVEGGLAATFAAYGTPTTTAVGAVLLYRLISYWALTGVGWLAIASLRPAVTARRRRSAERNTDGADQTT